MISYRKINNITGWVIFAIATLVYMLTVEPTASWWDCGEYIATAFKLQVGHPPGAPLFQLLGRFFSLFAFGNVTKVALMINIMSALSSSFTILFLFWSISMLAKKIALQKGEMTEGKMYMILGSAAVGALAYTFSDSFWFSAVEGEVYAMSSFFTALVFWAILKWEEDGATKSSNRWLILIAYLMGLSVGVHLLNLLAIPAIAFVFYYKKFKSTRKGFIITGIVSLLILAVIMYVIVPGIVSLSSSFELFFVNSIGLPFNSGTIIYFIIVISLLVYGIHYTIRKKKHVLNTIILGFTFILIGYSSFFMLVVRANADTPINENSPKDAISLLSYLNREQYGDWPIFYGAYYNAPVIGSEDTGKDYIRDDKSGTYVVAKNKFKYIYDPRFTTIFPRMWSSREPDHAQKYEEYIKGESIKVNDKTIIKPTFTDNLNYFVSYQIGYMYVRYFMWNFVGRQNDIESQGDPRMGNWISGIPFIDTWRIGSQKLLPDAFKNNATNKFYFLPLILGFLGIIFHVKRDGKDAWVVFLIFLMTGLAIVVYLNQYPYQPRERDYAYAGSFYAFAIWIGLGVMAIAEKTAVVIKNAKMNSLIVTALCLLLVPAIMASEGWDDHDRSGKYAARDFASNYLNHCDQNAVLYTVGDNDTFPLWYAQEVEGIRTDVRVVNYMLSSGSWYVDQMSRKIYNADPLPMMLTKDKYQKGTNDFVPYVDVKLEGYQELSEVMRIIASDNERTKIMYGREKVNFFPTKKIKITVDSAACVDNGIVPRELAHLIVKEIDWEISSNALYKNDLAFLDFLANNNWKRPIYFANPMVVKDVFNATDYFHLDGVVYKFMPIKAERANPNLGGILVDKTFDKLMNNSKWGNLNKPGVTVDRESVRNTVIVTSDFIRLTRELVMQNKIDMAIQLINRYYEQFPVNKFPQDIPAYSFLDAYYQGGEFEKAKILSQNLVNRFSQEFDYYSSLPNGVVIYDEAIKQSLGFIRGLSQLASQYKQTDYAKEIDAIFEQKVNHL